LFYAQAIFPILLFATALAILELHLFSGQKYLLQLKFQQMQEHLWLNNSIGHKADKKDYVETILEVY
jgi:hypothetical protein